MKRWRPDGGDRAKGYYGGYSEPSDQWEAEVRVTLDGTELELCQQCKAPVHYYDPGRSVIQTLTSVQLLFLYSRNHL